MKDEVDRAKLCKHFFKIFNYNLSTLSDSIQSYSEQSIQSPCDCDHAQPRPGPGQFTAPLRAKTSVLGRLFNVNVKKMVGNGWKKRRNRLQTVAMSDLTMDELLSRVWVDRAGDPAQHHSTTGYNALCMYERMWSQTHEQLF